MCRTAMFSWPRSPRSLPSRSVNFSANSWPTELVPSMGAKFGVASSATSPMILSSCVRTSATASANAWTCEGSTAQPPADEVSSVGPSTYIPYPLEPDHRWRGLQIRREEVLLERHGPAVLAVLLALFPAAGARAALTVPTRLAERARLAEPATPAVLAVAPATGATAAREPATASTGAPAARATSTGAASAVRAATHRARAPAAHARHPGERPGAETETTVRTATATAETGHAGDVGAQPGQRLPAPFRPVRERRVGDVVAVHRGRARPHHATTGRRGRHARLADARVRPGLAGTTGVCAVRWAAELGGVLVDAEYRVLEALHGLHGLALHLLLLVAEAERARDATDGRAERGPDRATDREPGRGAATRGGQPVVLRHAGHRGLRGPQRARRVLDRGRHLLGGRTELTDPSGVGHDRADRLVGGPAAPEVHQLAERALQVVGGHGLRAAVHCPLPAQGLELRCARLVGHHSDQRLEPEAVPVDPAGDPLVVLLAPARSVVLRRLRRSRGTCLGVRDHLEELLEDHAPTLRSSIPTVTLLDCTDTKEANRPQLSAGKQSHASHLLSDLASPRTEAARSCP